MNKLKPEIMPHRTLVDPAEAGELVECWRNDPSPRWPGDILPASPPATPGLVTTRYEDKDCIVVDLLWGDHGEDYIRATYRLAK